METVFDGPSDLSKLGGGEASDVTHTMDVRIAIVCDSYSPYLTTKRCKQVATWAEANNVEIA
ncbi:hypothetical protein ACIQM4_25425 [Streptomyces sp. NPDC091272]|uniref:hypothetical protein n=1 Tax=Streptomyces sp. NPDC091272 TaxID=3365981 RepID=UPI00381BD413